MQKYDVENSSVDHLNWTYKNIAIMNIFIQEEKEKKKEKQKTQERILWRKGPV